MRVGKRECHLLEESLAEARTWLIAQHWDCLFGSAGNTNDFG